MYLDFVMSKYIYTMQMMIYTERWTHFPQKF